MAKVSVVTMDQAWPVTQPEGYSGKAGTAAYLNKEQDPLHLYLHILKPGDRLEIGPREIDTLVYVWKGQVEAGGRRLASGSSLIVEHGESVAVSVGSGKALLLSFTAASPPEKPRAGGHVHLLPAENVPRSDNLGDSGVGGGMHFDASLPTCEIWLHENHFGPGEAPPPEESERGVHCHSEDEIIFVTNGQIRLGNKLCGPGTALAIAADTMYSFTPGPEGLSFINFRAGTPSDIRFANGATMSETGYWQDNLSERPKYLEPVG
ncbi:MAG: hypothetical protein R3E09_08950 [Novosphingobium sp.]|nr:hypothetical protein [Novosphingobium sp.]